MSASENNTKKLLDENTLLALKQYILSTKTTLENAIALKSDKIEIVDLTNLNQGNSD